MKTKREQLKQRIVATLIVFFMCFMISGLFGAFEVGAIGSNITFAANIGAGSLTFASSSSVAFPNMSIGTAVNDLANITQVNITDLRGSGAGWSVTGTANTFTATNAGTNTIANTFIAWFPANGTWAALSGVTTGILNGTAANFGSAAQLNLAAASVGNGMGNYTLSNVLVNIIYNGNTGQAAGLYQNTLTLTIT